MVRAYKAPGQKSQDIERYCTACDEWDDDSNWTQHEVVKFYDHERWVVYDNGSDFFFNRDDIENMVMFSHDNCDNYFEEEPEARYGEQWICGNCKSKYADQEHARNCCS